MPTISPDPVQTELPIQAPVEEPIINSPYYEPLQHWSYSKEVKAVKTPGRRRAAYFWTTQKSHTDQVVLDTTQWEQSIAHQLKS